MTTPNLAVTNISVAQKPMTDSNGKQVLGKQVSFNVGDHGPFFLNYADPTTPASTIKADMQKQVDELTEIHQWAG